ncbi:MAG: hypothetical protein GXP62_02270 [Oligoflexia bacterium]|nr:hypothetical protein [Oligoflexia bacterium]
MKYKVQVFERVTRLSESSGAVKSYPCRNEIIGALGQGDKIIFHGRVYDRSTTGRLGFVVNTGCMKEIRPFEDGFGVTLAGTYSSIDTTGAFTFETTVDFQHALDVVAQVEDSGAASPQSVDFEVWATIIQG